jgi:hypothetical protein
MTETAIDPELWKRSRAGARAGRGFRFQDAACALMAVQAWRGFHGWTAVIPEGADDASLHGSGLEIRAQVKSRHDPRGLFAAREVAQYLGKIISDLPTAWDSARIRLALVLERPVEGLAAQGWDNAVGADSDFGRFLARLLSGQHEAGRIAAALDVTFIVVVQDPIDEAVALLAQHAGLQPAERRIAVQNIRIDAGTAADANYQAQPGAAASLDASTVQAHLDALGRMSDPERWDRFADDLCVLAEFHAPVETTDFYSGVNVLPGHVGAGLVFERPAEVAELTGALERTGTALVAGPSGAGKSALSWLAAYETRHAVRWYRVRDLSRDKVSRLLAFALALDVDPARPVGFVVDDAGRDATGGWDLLVEEAASRPGVRILGSVREEDVFLLATAGRVATTRPLLDKDLAERIWSALSAKGQSRFAHWVEPFEMSQGLLLEYTHILTEGSRLEETLTGQVRRRLSETRDDELVLLERIVFAARFGGSVDGGVLRTRLGWEAPRFARALARLVEEHTVRERGAGVLGGLHELRSACLDQAIRDTLDIEPGVAAAQAIDALMAQDLPVFIPRVLREYPEVREPLLDALVDRLATDDLFTLQAALHGLGLASADEIAAKWLVISGELEVDERFSSLLFMLVDTGDYEGDLPLFAKLREAKAKFGEVAVEDLRVRVLDRFDGDRASGQELTPERLHHLQAALMPLKGAASAPDFKLKIADDQDLSPADLIPFLEIVRTTRDMDPEQADRLVAAAGGEQALLDRLAFELPWVTIRGCRQDGEDRVVEGYVHLISDEFQVDLHAEVIRLCELMLAAAGSASIAIADVMMPDGRLFAVGDYRPNAKRIAREALPTPSRIAWNRAQSRAIQRLIAAPQDTGRTKSLASSIVELSSRLDEAIVFYLRKDQPPDRWKLLVQVGAILQGFVRPPRVDEAMADPLAPGDAGAFDALHNFVTDVQGLITELVEDKDERVLLRATRVAKMAETALALSAPENWRMTAEPPLEALSSMRVLLLDLRAALGHIANDPGRRSRWAAQFSKMSKKNSPLARAAQEARETAGRELAGRCGQFRGVFASHGLDVAVYARPTEKDEGYAWPSVDYVAIMDTAMIGDWLATETQFVAATDALPSSPRVAYAPRINGKVAPMAIVRTGTFTLPHASFEREWAGFDGLEIVEAPLVDRLTDALKDLAVLSGMAQIRPGELNDVEYTQVELVRGRVEGAVSELVGAADAEPTVAFLVAAEFAERVRDKVSAELLGEGDGEPFVVEANRLALGDGAPVMLSPIMLELVEIRIALMEHALGVEARGGLSDTLAAEGA